MRWFMASTVAIALCGCSDDGVPQDVTSGSEDGAGTTGGGQDETAVTTDQTSATTAGTTDTNATTASDATSDVGDTTLASTGSDADSSSDGSSSSGSDTTDASSSTSSESSSDATGGGPLNVGDDCTDDAECMTLVCWDFSDYDAMCFGAACSGPCVGDDDCFALLTDAGAAYPEASTCGADGRCTMVSTGFGAFACASP